MRITRVVIAWMLVMLSIAFPPSLIVAGPYLIFETMRLLRHVRDLRNPDAAYIRQLERDLRNDRRRGK